MVGTERLPVVSRTAPIASRPEKQTGPSLRRITRTEMGGGATVGLLGRKVWKVGNAVIRV